MSAYSHAFSQAIEILLYIHFKSSEKKYSYLSTSVMSKGLNIPVPTLNKVLTKLKNAQLLVSKAGPTGGVALNKSIDEVTLMEVFLAIENENHLFSIHKKFNREVLYETEILDEITNNGIRVLNEAENSMHDVLKQYYLADLLPK
ncbi:RrF2 family transcriptional regulator [Isobaculum melis]|uniref:Rrf2 family protein n=1 Tax=Isobaculum melis TaxID=142588 RepID=A0A1H9PMH5_9LACT|nr:Rrf2 family transcriptional regulator [Isobaculum melis]SER49290.1 Rrf2 family protein [Isobaculum melis]